MAQRIQAVIKRWSATIMCRINDIEMVIKMGNVMVEDKKL